MHNEHLQRIKDSLSNAYTLANLSSWLARNTQLYGKPLNYKGREYQPTVIDNPAKTLFVVKCAQMGLSEIFARWALATVTTQEHFTTIYTFPAATDAELFSKSRLEPIINSSKAISRTISKSVNSVELKQFGTDSFLYTRGTFSETGALSVPADLLIHDEYDRSDMGNVAAYVSRLQAKPTKMRRIFSTPTVAKYGIDAECQTSKRYRQLWKCSHCNHYFLPSYHHDVVVPGFGGEKREITKTTIKDLKWREAKLLCPKCGGEPDSDISHRFWVLENSQESFDAVAYYIAPFCAPMHISMPYLVEVSTLFNKWSEFCNQALGETSEESTDTLTEIDIRGANTPADLSSGDMHFMGCDMGLTCHFAIGRVSNGRYLIVHREKVFYTQFEEKRRELCAKYRILVSVHDMFPYTDIVTRVVNFDPNAYGAIYVDKKSTETHTVRDQDENQETGRLNVRAVMINRNVAFDELMAVFKSKNISIHAIDEEFIHHCRDMKRIQKFSKQQAMYYAWEKTSGEDHYFHALLYFYIATKLRGTAGAWTDAGVIPLVSSFTPKIYGERERRIPVYSSSTS